MLRQDAKKIYTAAIREALPNDAVKNCLKDMDFGPGRVVIVAIGKAAWEMSRSACDVLGDRASGGVVITKYGHSKGSIDGLQIVEAGHPVPDENAFRGAKLAMDAVSGLSREDTVLFLVSGGGSALFERTELPLEELQDINSQLLAGGADIKQINTIRKRLSQVKGGRFALACGNARIVAVILSDIVDDSVDMIASGPVCADISTCAEAMAIARSYGLRLSHRATELLQTETPKQISNVQYHMCGSVRQLCETAARKCRELGYETVILTTCLSCTARDAGVFLGNIARTYDGSGKKLAFIAGGETVVHLTGKGKGGRNQEIALAAADVMAGCKSSVVFSVGSDGTDGPTDAAGGIVDGNTRQVLLERGIRIPEVLENNDAYHGLQACDGLIITGPTGTNVNDLAVVLINE